VLGESCGAAVVTHPVAQYGMCCHSLPPEPNNGTSDKHHPSDNVSTTQIELTTHRNGQGDNVGRAVPSTSRVRVPVPFRSVSTSRGRECPPCLCTLRMVTVETEEPPLRGAPVGSRDILRGKETLCRGYSVQQEHSEGNPVEKKHHVGIFCAAGTF
jgi:hypothetical protein